MELWGSFGRLLSHLEKSLKWWRRWRNVRLRSGRALKALGHLKMQRNFGNKTFAGELSKLVTLLKAFSQWIIVYEDVFCLSLTLIIGFVKDERLLEEIFSSTSIFPTVLYRDITFLWVLKFLWGGNWKIKLLSKILFLDKRAFYNLPWNNLVFGTHQEKDSKFPKCEDLYVSSLILFFESLSNSNWHSQNCWYQ